MPLGPMIALKGMQTATCSTDASNHSLYWLTPTTQTSNSYVATAPGNFKRGLILIKNEVSRRHVPKQKGTVSTNLN